MRSIPGTKGTASCLYIYMWLGAIMSQEPSEKLSFRTGAESELDVQSKNKITVFPNSKERVKQSV